MTTLRFLLVAAVLPLTACQGGATEEADPLTAETAPQAALMPTSASSPWMR